MGEAKQRGSRKERIVEAVSEALTKQLGNEGRIIEGGWLALRAVWLPKDAPDDQVYLLRKAFMAGAQHLFASIMTILDAGEDATEADVARLEAIHAELELFRAEIEGRRQSGGTA